MCSRSHPQRPATILILVNCLLRYSLIALAASLFTACSTVNDLVVSNIPSFKEGKTSVVVDLSNQEAYLLKRGEEVAASRISTGREGFRTPTGRFKVIRKDQDHRSSLYGDYVDADGHVVKANVDVRKHAKPRGSHFVGAPMPYFVEFKPSYGLHAGHLPGYPASHGCVRMPYWRARQFFHAVHLGTPVLVKH
jgi:lipoprotein-anchoring transpeptidase ErfK/SrfK